MQEHGVYKLVMRLGSQSRKKVVPTLLTNLDIINIFYLAFLFLSLNFLKFCSDLNKFYLKKNKLMFNYF